ncbi:MAG: VWA domain-containing protein [Caldilineales bacterium]|nr:VWA domain-containing protein [Caldilineales bacterium]
MTFANPQFLILMIILLPAASIFLWWASRSRREALARLGESALIRRLSASINWRGRRWRSVLWMLAVALLLFAMARPQWGYEEREIEQEGLQVMVALDVSQSMLTEDVKPNRLARAKLEISDLMNQLNGDEIGLALFSGASFVQIPLTSDYNTALSYLDSAGPQVISRPGTVIGEAIRTAMRGFDPELSSQKVLIVMTDGEDRETDPLAAAQEAADAGVLIYTIGFGTPEGEPVPETNELGQVIGYKADENGNPVVSRLDEGTLIAIAQTGNGRYFRATPAGDELAALLNEIDSLQTAQLQSRMERTMIERYQPFLALALLLLILAELIPDRVSVRTRKTLVQRLSRRRRSAVQTISS